MEVICQLVHLLNLFFYWNKSAVIYVKEGLGYSAFQKIWSLLLALGWDLQPHIQNILLYMDLLNISESVPLFKLGSSDHWSIRKLTGLEHKETSGRLSHEFSHWSICTHTALDQCFFQGEFLLILSSKYNINRTYNKLSPWTCTKSGASNHPGLGLLCDCHLCSRPPWVLAVVGPMNLFLSNGNFPVCSQNKESTKKVKGEWRST